MIARISNPNKTDNQIEKEQHELNRVKRIYYRNIDDFYAPVPPHNEEVEILGYFYKQPSTKWQDKEEE